MLQKYGALLVLGTFAIGLHAQGLDTQASKDDWEEINFEFNSSVLVDGFPSLLRLAELLQSHADYRVRVEGYTDGIGSAAYNDRLGLARATQVRDFLVKYGARSNQFDLISRGKNSPKVPREKPGYQKTDEARYMNRRVVLTVMDAQGRTVGAGGAGDAIRALQPAPATNPDCCNDVLKRLDKLDDIAKLLKDLADANAGLRQEVAGLKDKEDALERRIGNTPPPPPPPPGPSADDIANAVSKQVETDLAKDKKPSFELLGVNVGADNNGNGTFTGRGRYFKPLNDNFAFQAQAEYLYYHGQREGQFDFGVVDRIGRFQMGLFSSFKEVTLAGYQSSATLGQAAFTADYIFGRGKVGIFGTEDFLSGGVINTVNAVGPTGILLNHLFVQNYIDVVNQYGVSGTVGLMGNVFAEGNVGYLRSQVNGDRIGGTLRFVFPLNNKIAFTLEGGVNETMLRAGNSGRVAVGVQLSNLIRPKEFLAANHALPMDVPRVRYEIGTRNLRNGDDPPIANAGPDQLGVPAGPINLDGSASYSPDGLPLKFQWTEVGGVPVTLSSITTAKTSFVAAAGITYTFRLTVTDSLGAQASAEVHVSTLASPRAAIVFFISTPASIQSGQSSTLSWRVVNATAVVISPNVGPVASSGSVPVSPTQTTTYTITAQNSVNQATASTVVVVGSAAPALTYCYANPTTVTAGQSATLNWSAANSTNVIIQPNIGTEPATGSVTVTPTQTTAYTITANGTNGTATTQCGVMVTVGPGGGGGTGLPVIATFAANPPSINLGASSTLTWTVTNATNVTISPTLGTVSPTGSQSVSPTTTTTYTLTATNATGTSTSTATVTVVNPAPPVSITSFTANPTVSPAPGDKVTLTCTATGATGLNINGLPFPGSSASAIVFPTTTTTYTCVATGAGGQTATSTVTVTVTPPTGPTTPQGPTIVIAGGTTIQTINRDNILNASGSFSPQGNNPLTFFWTSPNAAVLNANSAMPQIQLPVAEGDYVVYLTVTDSKGNSSTQTIVLQYRGTTSDARQQ
jgi:hypothetical protein